MIDHFAVLRLPKRPWLELDQLKAEYQKRTLASHPDRTKADNRQEGDFAAVTEAYRVLSNPRLRLQHLLGLQADAESNAEAVQVTSDLSEVFMSAATLAREIDALLQKREGVTSSLGKSLLQSDVAKLRARCELMLQQLQSLHTEALDQLRRADQTWIVDPSKTHDQLRLLAQRFAFLDRWMDQLREKDFQLSS